MPFPDKDLSNDEHSVTLPHAIRPLAREEEYEKQFFKTDINCTSDSSGFDATWAARSSNTK